MIAMLVITHNVIKHTLTYTHSFTENTREVNKTDRQFKTRKSALSRTENCLFTNAQECTHTCTYTFTHARHKQIFISGWNFGACFYSVYIQSLHITYMQHQHKQTLALLCSLFSTVLLYTNNFIVSKIVHIYIYMYKCTYFYTFCNPKCLHANIFLSTC